MQLRRDSACWEPAGHEPLSGTSVSEIAERGLRVSADLFPGRLPVAHIPCGLRFDGRF